MGTPDKGGIGDEFFEVRWDYAERRVYGTSSLICDLDESLFFTSLWDGFTTGEVYMSIHAEGYQNSLMNMVITDIGDRKLSDNVFCDVDAPTLTVDYADYTASTVPDAQLNRPYRVFDATAYDSRDGQLPVTTNVYYNYRSTSKARIPVDNGVFTPPVSRRIYDRIYGNRSVGQHSLPNGQPDRTGGHCATCAYDRTDDAVR